MLFGLCKTQKLEAKKIFSNRKKDDFYQGIFRFWSLKTLKIVTISEKSPILDTKILARGDSPMPISLKLLIKLKIKPQLSVRVQSRLQRKR